MYRSIGFQMKENYTVSPSFNFTHWRICGGGASLALNYFILMQFSGKIGQIIGGPPFWGWRSLREILDPPLLLVQG